MKRAEGPGGERGSPVGEQRPAGRLVALPGESLRPRRARHRVVEGDNLPVLQALAASLRGRVKLAYLDPPYNGRQRFAYDDRVGPRRDRHRAWQEMMRPRLELVRELLRDDGVIAVSIDHHELARLLLLMEEIFGEEHFLALVKWRRRSNQPNDPTVPVARVSELVILWARDGAALSRGRSFFGLPLEAPQRREFRNPDGDARGPWASKPWRVAVGQTGSRYAIATPRGAVHEGEWMGDQATFRRLLAEGRIHFPRGGAGLPRKKYYLAERELEGRSPTDFWTAEECGTNQEASRELEELFGRQGVFEGAKPVRLVRRLLQLFTRGEDLVLDPFAGSGTTGEAVLRQNHADGGRRAAVLVQSAEPLRGGDGTIAALTRERMRRAIRALEAEGAPPTEGFVAERWLPARGATRR